MIAIVVDDGTDTRSAAPSEDALGVDGLSKIAIYTTDAGVPA